MATKIKRPEAMRANPRADWKIADVQALCRQVGLSCRAPSGGGHFTVTSQQLDGILTVPARRPIKPVYIRRLVAMADAHRQAAAKRNDDA